jgi:hypothetical protein
MLRTANTPSSIIPYASLLQAVSCDQGYTVRVADAQVTVAMHARTTLFHTRTCVLPCESVTWATIVCVVVLHTRHVASVGPHICAC